VDYYNRLERGNLGGSLPRLNAAATGPVFELRSGLVDLAGA
jgi:hypothetical protein